MKTISTQQIILVHDFVLKKTGGMSGIRDYGRLDSVVASQTQNVFGRETYPTILHKAASILRGIICDHPFLDGNKRTGILCAIVFLSVNDIIFATQQSEIEDFAVKVATEKLHIDDIVEWLKINTIPRITT